MTKELLFKVLFFILLGLFLSKIFMRFNFLKKMFFTTPKEVQFKTVDQSFFKSMQEKVIFYTLKNGLEVVILPDAREQRVFMQCAYRVGSANETSQTRGMAHLLEHMLFKGTEEMSESDWPKIAFKFGARLNAYTDYDYTVYYFDTDKANYEPFLDILADSMSNAKIDPQCLASELKAVVQELNMYRDDVWEELFNLMIKGVLPANHPYANPVIGYVQELASLKAEVLKNFYKKYYHPANATLFVIGNVDVDTLKQQIEDKFGSIPSTGVRAQPMFPPVIKEPKLFKGELLHNVATPCVKLLWITPGLNDLKAFAARKILAAALVSGKSGRLYKKLVDQEKVATFVQVDDASKLIQTYGNAGFFEISITCDQKNIDRCVELVTKELEEIEKNGIDPMELEQCKAQEVTDFVNIFEHGYEHGFNTFGFLFKCMYFATDDINSFFYYPTILQGINNKDIVDFVKANVSHKFFAYGVAKPISPENQELCNSYQAALKVEEAKVLANHVRTTKVEEPRRFYEVADVVPMPFSMPKPTFDKVLSNGLRVIGLQRKGIPSVSCVLQSVNSQWISNVLDIKDAVRGAEVIRPGALESLSCGLVANLLLQNSQGYLKQENSRIFNKLGAKLEFRADKASLYVTSANFKEAFEHFAHVCFKPEFRDSDLEGEKEIAKDIIGSHKSSNRYVAFNSYYKKAFDGTDFSWSFDQALEKLEKVTTENLSKTHLEFYSPENLVLVLVGDFTDQTLVDCQKVLLNVCPKNSPNSVPKIVPLPKPVDQESVKIQSPSDQQFMLMIRPSMIKIDHKDSPLANMLTNLVLSGMGSKIWALREQTGLFYSAGGVFAAHLALAGSSINGPFDSIRAIVNPKNALTLQEKIVQMLAQVSENPEMFGPEDLDGAKQCYLETLLNICSSNSNLANSLAKLVVLKLGFDYFDKSWQSVSNVTQSDIERVCKDLCNVDSMTTLFVGGQD